MYLKPGWRCDSYVSNHVRPDLLRILMEFFKGTEGNVCQLTTPSRVTLPRVCLRFAMYKCTVNAATMEIMRMCELVCAVNLVHGLYIYSSEGQTTRLGTYPIDTHTAV